MVYSGRWFADNLAYWSSVASDPSQSDRDRMIAQRVTSIDNLVISDSLKIDPTATWADHTQVVSRADAARVWPDSQLVELRYEPDAHTH